MPGSPRGLVAPYTKLIRFNSKQQTDRVSKRAARSTKLLLTDNREQKQCVFFMDGKTDRLTKGHDVMTHTRRHAH